MKFTEQQEVILSRHVKDGKVITLPRKLNKKKILLGIIAENFEIERLYSEKEVNNILVQWYDDYVILRRYLVDFKFLTREDDGSSYVKEKQLY